MVGRKGSVEFRMRIVCPHSKINRRTTFRCSGESIIIRFISKINIRRVESYSQHTHLESNTQFALSDFHLVGILSPKTLVAEQSDGFIEESNSNAMLFIE